MANRWRHKHAHKHHGWRLKVLWGDLLKMTHISLMHRQINNNIFGWHYKGPRVVAHHSTISVHSYFQIWHVTWPFCVTHPFLSTNLHRQCGINIESRLSIRIYGVCLRLPRESSALLDCVAKANFQSECMLPKHQHSKT